jgi:hypothetical protein
MLNSIGSPVLETYSIQCSLSPKAEVTHILYIVMLWTSGWPRNILPVCDSHFENCRLQLLG